MATSAYPNAANTGVPAGTALKTYNGTLVVTEDNAVISGLKITGNVVINAKNVTIENCVIDTTTPWHAILIPDGYTGFTLKNSEINGNGQTVNAISGAGTFLNNDIQGVQNGINVYGASLIENNYIHDMKGGSDSHFDGIENNGASGMTLIHNTIINDHDQTSAVMLNNEFGALKNITIDDNYLVGGGYTVYLDGRKGGGAVDDASIKITNNHIGQGYWGDFSFYDDTPITSGNSHDLSLLSSIIAGTATGGTTTGGTGSTGSGSGTGTGSTGSGTGTDTGSTGSGTGTGTGSTGSGTGTGTGSTGSGTGTDTGSTGSGAGTGTGSTGSGTGTGTGSTGSGTGTGTGSTGSGTGTGTGSTGSGTGTGTGSHTGTHTGSWSGGHHHFTKGTAHADTFDMSKGAYSVDGGTGRDTVSFSAAKSGLGLDLTKGVGTSGAASGATFKSIEKVTGSNFSDTITGNGANNALLGQAGNDTVSGKAGNDTLSGGLGNDKLTGGLGRDTFKFDSALNAKTNVDTITDFSVTADRFALASEHFKGLKVGSLSADQFYVGSHAHDANDRVIYDSKTGALSYDADGNGHGAAVQFATLKPGLAVDHHDFLIV